MKPIQHQKQSISLPKKPKSESWKGVEKPKVSRETKKGTNTHKKVSRDNLDIIKKDISILRRELEAPGTSKASDLNESIDVILKNLSALKDTKFQKLAQGLQQLKDDQTIKEGLPELLNEYEEAIAKTLEESLGDLKKIDKQTQAQDLIKNQKTLEDKIDLEFMILKCIDSIKDFFELKGYELKYYFGSFGIQLDAINYLLQREKIVDPEKRMNYVSFLTESIDKINPKSETGKLAIKLLVDNLKHVTNDFIRRDAYHALRDLTKRNLNLDLTSGNEIAEAVLGNLKDIRGKPRTQAFAFEILRNITAKGSVSLKVGDRIATRILKNFSQLKDLNNSIKDIQPNAHIILGYLAKNKLISDNNAILAVNKFLDNLKSFEGESYGSACIALSFFATNALISSELGNQCATKILESLKDRKDTANANQTLAVLLGNNLIDDQKTKVEIIQRILENVKKPEPAQIDGYSDLSFLTKSTFLDQQEIKTLANAVLKNIKKLKDKTQSFAYLSLVFLAKNNSIDEETKSTINKMLSGNKKTLFDRVTRLLPRERAWTALLMLEKDGLIGWDQLDKFLNKQKVGKMGIEIAEAILERLPSENDATYWALGTLINNRMINNQIGEKIGEKILEIWPNLSNEMKSATIPIQADLIRLNLVSSEMKRRLESQEFLLWSEKEEAQKKSKYPFTQ